MNGGWYLQVLGYIVLLAFRDALQFTNQGWLIALFGDTLRIWNQRHTLPRIGFNMRDKALLVVRAQLEVHRMLVVANPKAQSLNIVIFLEREASTAVESKKSEPVVARHWLGMTLAMSVIVRTERP